MMPHDADFHAFAARRCLLAAGFRHALLPAADATPHYYFRFYFILCFEAFFFFFFFFTRHAQRAAARADFAATLPLLFRLL